jgi:hypothetical protein
MFRCGQFPALAELANPVADRPRGRSQPLGYLGIAVALLGHQPGRLKPKLFGVVLGHHEHS